MRTGKFKVFENREMSPDVVLASACPPYVFQAIEIDGENYWDGGFMGNPAFFPLIYNGWSKVVIIVQINPLERKKLPMSAPQIFDRMNEISFNFSLMREMRAIACDTKLVDEEALDAKNYKRLLVHSIGDDRETEALGVATQLKSEWDLHTRLRDAWRRNAGAWLDMNFASVRQASSIDIGATFL
jgi:NTE family protein